MKRRYFRVRGHRSYSSWDKDYVYAELDEITLNVDYAKTLFGYNGSFPRILDYELKAKVKKPFPSTLYLITYLQEHSMTVRND